VNTEILNKTVTSAFFIYTFDNATSSCGYFVISITSQNGPQEAATIGGNLQECFNRYEGKIIR